MPDPTPLTATPSSARALAAAGAGESVTLRVPFSEQPPAGLEITFSGVFGWSAVDSDGRIYSFRPPVAEGERVAVTWPCPAFHEEDESCGCVESCRAEKGYPATVLATPTPERHGEPDQWRWRVEVRRDEGEEEARGDLQDRIESILVRYRTAYYVDELESPLPLVDLIARGLDADLGPAKAVLRELAEHLADELGGEDG